MLRNCPVWLARRCESGRCTAVKGLHGVVWLACSGEFGSAVARLYEACLGRKGMFSLGEIRMGGAAVRWARCG